MIRVTRHGKVLHIETDIGSISIHDEVLRSGNASFETRILCYLADYLEKPRTAAPVVSVDIANARRLYHHFANGGTLTKGDVSRLVQAIEVRDTQSPAAPGIDLELLIEIRNRLHAMACRIGDEWEAEASELQRDAQKVIDSMSEASPKGGSTDPFKLPCLSFAVFDEFGVGADDRVADYGRACATAAMQTTSHGAGEN